MNKIILCFLLLTIVSCQPKAPEKLVLAGNAFGTTYTIQYFSEDMLAIEKGVDSVIYKVNRSVSTYQSNSDISKINEGDTTVVVDDIFKEVFRVSEAVYTNSKGYFDPTIGVLRNAYGFGDEKPLDVMDSLTLDSLMHYVGFRKVKLMADGTIKKELPEIYFDFNALAKGFGIDLIGNYMERQGINNYIIELGGEILAKGRNLAKDKKWIAGVEAIDSELENRSTAALVILENKAMAASGNYRKFRIDSATGKKYVHTINPLTGAAQQSDVTSATVIASSCILADAYATAFMAMGLERSKGLLATLTGVDAYLTYNNAANEPGVFITEGFKEVIQKSTN